MATTQYDVGDVVVLDCVFTVEDAETDPATVTLKVKPPTGSVETYTYAASEITRVAEGRFRRNVSATAAGTWHYRWIGTGDAAGAEEGSFWVRVSAVE